MQLDEHAEFFLFIPRPSHWRVRNPVLLNQVLMAASDNPFYTALTLILSMDSNLIDIVALSLQVSLSAVLIASALALPVGAALALWRFPGRNGMIVVLNALMGLPPVVAGLCVYLMLSRAGPLGSLGLLFTPSAMVVAQVILVFPIIAALTRQQVEALHHEYDEQLRSLGLTPLRMMPTLLWDARFGLLTVVFGWLRPCQCRSGCGDDRRRQYRWGDARDDHQHRAGNQQGRSAVGTRPGHHPAGAGHVDQCAGPCGQ